MTTLSFSVIKQEGKDARDFFAEFRELMQPAVDKNWVVKSVDERSATIVGPRESLREAPEWNLSQDITLSTITARLVTNLKPAEQAHALSFLVYLCRVHFAPYCGAITIPPAA